MANNNSNKLSRSIDTLNFLKEYATQPDRNFEDVAIKLGISEQNAENYLIKYIYLVRNTEKDKDFPCRARLVLNNNVPTEFHISDDELKALHTLVDEYDFESSVNDSNSTEFSQGLKNNNPDSRSSNDMIRRPLDDRDRNNKNNINNDPREQNSQDYARL